MKVYSKIQDNYSSPNPKTSELVPIFFINYIHEIMREVVGFTVSLETRLGYS